MDEKIGRYEIKRLLGRGGMASVYLAHDPSFDRDIAVKVLPRQFLHDPQFSVRFLREAKAIASLEHSSIVPVYDFGEDDGQPFIVMRYMPGGTLEERIRKGPLSIDDATRIIQRIASALEVAHRKGIVHRDLKPGNILFDNYDSAFLADFGIAKVAEASATLTGSGVIGTPAYMSPEQAVGKSGVDSRSDLYSLGIILYQMLTGKLPFDADTPVALALAHINEPVPDIKLVKPDTPPWLDAVLNKSLAKSPDERYSTATEMAGALSTRQAPETQTIAPPPVSAMPTERAPAPAADKTFVQTAPPAAPAQSKTAGPAAMPQAPAPKKQRFPVWIFAGGAVILGFICIAAVAYFVWPSLFGGAGAPTDNPTEIAAAAEPTDTPVPPTETQTPSSTATATATNTPPATITGVPSDTPTPEPLEALFTASQSLFCREGPGTQYESVYNVGNGSTLPALARWDNDWIMLGVDDPIVTRTRCCWVSLIGELNVEMTELPLISVVPDRINCEFNPEE